MRKFIEIESFGQMPNQLLAKTTDGEWVYMRARFGFLTLEIAPSEEAWLDSDDENEFVVYEEGSPENKLFGWENEGAFRDRFAEIIVAQNLGSIVD